MKVGRKMGHGTLTTGKVLRSGYLGNGCYGDEKRSLFSMIPLIWEKCTRKVHNGWEQKLEIAVAIETNMFPWLR